MAGDKVKVFGMWASPFALRVEWALKLKGVDYEYINEDLPHNKSQELLQYNPVTKKIPVLVHREKAIAESSVIVGYIDEAWGDGYSIMPRDPFERAQARFWAKFVEDECVPSVYKVYFKTGEELQKAVIEVQESLWTLEEALKGKKFFGGENIGYVDIIAGWIPYWLRMIEDLAGVSILSDENLPSINAWFNAFSDVEAVKEALPPKDKLYAFNRDRREKLISGELNYKK
ncbi:glutathione transferase GST 23-like [Asparagus officinalis]|uniref:glutathione transferase GST 23-like n=1 Tax=Asparagus officinalis TaxID=4686 RepID=UPI00098E0F2C|nr:glutathione transferase GST 23-like [Asparagus officinalis]